jgi:hypothetical protein
MAVPLYLRLTADSADLHLRHLASCPHVLATRPRRGGREQWQLAARRLPAAASLRIVGEDVNGRTARGGSTFS